MLLGLTKGREHRNVADQRELKNANVGHVCVCDCVFMCVTVTVYVCMCMCVPLAGIGVVDGTLGSCAGVGPCMSSYDDRPGHFIAPWAHEERSRYKAMDRIEVAVMKVR